MKMLRGFMLIFIVKKEMYLIQSIGTTVQAKKEQTDLWNMNGKKLCRQCFDHASNGSIASTLIELSSKGVSDASFSTVPIFLN